MIDHTAITNPFMGIEIEKTKFFGMKTLFISQLDMQSQTVADIAFSKQIQHIYVGANQSVKYYHDLADAILLSKKLLDAGFFVTLDAPIEFSTEKWRHQNLCMIWNCHGLQNTDYIKIDSVYGDRSVPGVWLKLVENMKTQDDLTVWEEYTKDENI